MGLPPPHPALSLGEKVKCFSLTPAPGGSVATTVRIAFPALAGDKNRHKAARPQGKRCPEANDDDNNNSG
jgi:hypothetical protein